MAIHRYEAQVHWSGSTGAGWDHYDRAHSVTAPPAEPVLTVTTGEAKGDPAQLNPEQLVVMAASSCQMLMFLHLAAKARIDVVEYSDDAEGLMPLDQQPVRIAEITLRPRIVLASEATDERVHKLVELAHEECFIANSLNSEMRIEPTIERAKVRA